MAKLQQQEVGQAKYELYGDDDYGYGDSLSTDDEKQDIGPEEEILLWDSFKCTKAKPKSGSMVEKRWYEVMLRIIKGFLYLILFAAILGGSMIAKATVLFATSQLSGKPIPFCYYYPGRNAREAYTHEASLTQEATIPWYWVIVYVFSVAEVLDFLRFLWNCFFVDIEFPKPRYIGLLSLLEALHAFGMALLFLVALPNLDALQSVAALTCICIVPNVLGFLTRFTTEPDKAAPSPFAIYGDIAAFLGQLGGLLSFTYLASVNEDAFAPWTLPIALLLASLRWWGNYVSEDSRFGFITFLAEARGNLQAYRPVLIGYTSVLRIVVFFLSALLISFWKGIEPEAFLRGFWWNDYNHTIIQTSTNSSEVINSPESIISKPGYRWTPYYVFLISAVSGVCVYNSAKFACRTLMQGFGFALPLNLASVLTFAGLWILASLRGWDECYYHGAGALAELDQLFFNVPEVAEYASHWYAWLWLLWLMSQLWITVHIWSTRNERLATTDRIFGCFSYDALVVDQSLAMSRWREEPDDDIYLQKFRYDEEAVKITKNLSVIKKSDHVTRLYACATMWHETADEMADFFSSILRLDRDQCIMRILQKQYRITSPDYYDLEVHIFFDDAFKCVQGCAGRCTHDENKTQVNDYVVDFVKAVEESIRSRKLRPSPPVKYPTPYGGRLLWILPEKTKMYLHLKDKNKIRTRKRWSQVMYMYYLLGFRLMELPIEVERKEVIAENTYILTLDGDIDFRPSAVRTLIDRMKINKDLGSACGRIHPLGKGPLVWFQKFEYAIGHWLQKSTEHTIGCVLCSPGCFALFRAKALMDFNVMKKYATVPKEAQHFIQYDQGEDRWLCTLILQMGYKVEYSAASDAYTHAPETFNQFFIQRRRWIPSTVANIFDLLETARETKKVNRDISWVYILYQWLLMGSTILGPGTIFLMLVGAFVAAIRIDNWTSFYYNLIPIFIFCLVCFLCKEKTQLFVAGIITAVYGLVMIVVLVGIMIQIAEDGWLAPSTLLFFLVAGELVITGLLHPLEWSCLIYGVIYYVTVPSMYMLLIIFSLFNMNNISWGTRDAPKAPSPQEDQQQAATTASDKSKKEPAAKSDMKRKLEKAPVEFSIAGLFKCMLCAREQPPENEAQLKEINSSLAGIQERLDAMERNADSGSRSTRELGLEHRGNPAEESTVNGTSASSADELNEQPPSNSSNASSDLDSDVEDWDSLAPSSIHGSDNFLVSPNWLHSKDLGKGEVEYLKSEEEIFWKRFISTYLDPIDKDEKREAEIAKKIKDLRDEYIFKFFMINALFVLVVFLMQLKKDTLYIQWPLGKKYNISYDSERVEVNINKEYLALEPIGCLFILGFVSILLVQFVAMLFHRFDTFSHIMAKVTLDWYCFDKTTDLSEESVIERYAEKMTKEIRQQIDGESKSDAAHNSAIPPRKRMTIHQNMVGHDRRNSYAPTLSSALKRNLEDSGENGGFIAKRMSQTALRALKKRRTTILAEKRQSQMADTGADNIYASADDVVNPSTPRRSTGIFQAYQNPAFTPDEFTIKESDRK